MTECEPPDESKRFCVERAVVWPVTECLPCFGRHGVIRSACKRLADAGIRVSIFIDPDLDQLQAARDCGAPVVELHTGAYADAAAPARPAELERIVRASEFGHSIGLHVNAGHGLHYTNVQPIVAIPQLVELNIGHAIVARALFVGLDQAVREMRALMSRPA